jgi:hypothetical protein
LTSADGSYNETAWIAKDSRTTVKDFVIEAGGNKGGTISTTMELTEATSK